LEWKHLFTLTDLEARGTTGTW